VELLFTNATFTAGTHDTQAFYDYIKSLVAVLIGTLAENINIVQTFSGSVGVELEISSDGLTSSSFDGLETAILFDLQQSNPHSLGDSLDVMMVEPLTRAPTESPTKRPTDAPTTDAPTPAPTPLPTTAAPTTAAPTGAPTPPPVVPATPAPTPQPTTGTPTTANPTAAPTAFVHRSRTVLSEYAILGIVAASSVAVMVINIGIHGIVKQKFVGTYSKIEFNY
jgi:hypothetical protein